MRRLASLLVLLAPLGWASTVKARSLAGRVGLSHRVALVQVLAQRVELGPDGRPTKTLTRVVVGEDLKGAGPGELTIVQVGGRAGPWQVRVAGDATFEVGETALVFLVCRQAQRCTLLGLGDGKLAVDASGAVRQRDGETGRWTARPLGEVVAELRGAAAGRVSAGEVAR